MNFDAASGFLTYKKEIPNHRNYNQYDQSCGHNRNQRRKYHSQKIILFQLRHLLLPEIL